VKSKDWSDSLLEEHRQSMHTGEGQEALDAMVRDAIVLRDYECAPGWHGVVRDFRYVDHSSTEWPFAFIVNRNDLLFYVRKIGLRRVTGGFKALKAAFPSARENSAGEWTVRIESEQHARLVNTTLFGPMPLTHVSTALLLHPTKDLTMIEPFRRPAALVKQGTLRLYTTSLQARHLLTRGFYDIERLDPENAYDKGYQRVLNTARAKRLGDYLVSGQEQHDAFLPTSIFLATDKELEFDAVNNLLEIDISKVGSFSVVDGQHRLEGLRYAAESFQI
jgi:hypothetical protein